MSILAIPTSSITAALRQVLGTRVSDVRTAQGLCTTADESLLITLYLLKTPIAAER